MFDFNLYSRQNFIRRKDLNDFITDMSDEADVLFYFTTIVQYDPERPPIHPEHYVLATLNKTYYEEVPKLDTSKWKIDLFKHEAILNGYFVELRVDFASKLFIEKSSKVLRFGTTEIELQ